MPNLFPENVENENQEIEIVDEVPFGRSWKFDFEKGEFDLSPTGKIIRTEGVESWLEWCQKALNTERYKYLAYTDDHGQEFNDLISRHLTREANESEIRRMVTECLMVDPRTASVDNFTFKWENEKLYFTCEITNVRGENGTINGSVVIS